MFEEEKKRESEMRRVLTLISNGTDMNKMSDADRKILKGCSDRGYFTGIRFGHNVEGETNGQKVDDGPQLTESGKKFIQQK